MGSLSEQGLSSAAEALHYAHEIAAGRIPACKWTKAACQRQIDDLARWQNDQSWPFEWRPDLADHAIRFIELLRHVKGRWAGSRLQLHPSQKFSLACVFGWVRKSDGKRRFRTVYEEVPRKNAKTTKLAGIALYAMAADGEFGAEVYSAATTRDQAKIVFSIAQQMARMDGALRARFGVEVLAHSLIKRDDASIIQPLSADGHTLDGLNVHAALIDELHAHKTRVIYDVLDTGTGARDQPLIWSITTAGSNRAGVCYDVRGYLCRVLNSVLSRHDGMGYSVKGAALDDESFWGIIYTLDDEDLVTPEAALDERLWPKANPLWDVSVDPEDMRRLATKARGSPQALSAFLTKRLNVWVNADAAWMNMLKWDACADPQLREEQFSGAQCIVALDAAFKRDLFARVKLFERAGIYYAFCSCYTHQALVQADGNEHLAAWAQAGFITATPGEVLDISAVREDLLADTRTHEVVGVPYDPAQLTQFATEMLNDHGVPMVEMRATVMNFSPAMKELEERVIAGTFRHDGNPVLGWAIANVVCHRDRKDNIYPVKERAADKIDPAIALIMAIARLMVRPEESTSVFDDIGRQKKLGHPVDQQAETSE